MPSYKDSNDENDSISSIFVDPTVYATSVVSSCDLLQREIDKMKNDIKELKDEILPENHERMEASISAMKDNGYFKNLDCDSNDDEEDDLPTLSVEESESEDDFDQRIEELSDFMEDMGIGPSTIADCEIIESDIPFEY